MNETIEFRGGAGTIAADRWTSDDGLAGRGAVLMLHGGGQTRHSWNRAAATLSRDGWTVYTLDARGHGDSDWAPDGDYQVDSLVDDLRGVIDQLGEAPVLFGASLGGMTGLIAEGENPGLMRGLVLVDITPKVEPEGVKRIADFMQGNPDGFASLDEVADAVAAYQQHRSRPSNIEGLRRNVRERSNGRLYWHWDPAFAQPGGMGDIITSDHHGRMVAAAQGVEVPTLLVHGGKSDIVSTDGVEELLGLIPHATAVNVSAAGHMVAGDDNAVFTMEVGGFLDGLT
ncbi:alpha/beta fold hydrolase [Rhodococcus sp. UNC363MFTsu5.1]|uniref:alpha/beta fold hydrolase n=1 Tax=Rhodococcus sp. UNC363MFTsu5.1 TaxID=1449069 RepID=UPI00068C97FB|nr:alpha/beta hydrolase [Rhodococcus sp. UNC363MFTsu5.1]